MVPRGTSWHYNLQINHCLVAATESLWEAFGVVQYFSNQQSVATRNIRPFVRTLPAILLRLNNCNDDNCARIFPHKTQHMIPIRGVAEEILKSLPFLFLYFVITSDLCVFLSARHDLQVIPAFLFSFFLFLWKYKTCWQRSLFGSER